MAAELLRLAKPFVEDGVHPQIIIRASAGCLVVRGRRTRSSIDSSIAKLSGCANVTFFCRCTTAFSILCLQGYRKAAQLAIEKLNSIAIHLGNSVDARRTLLEKCAKTSLNSKLIARYQDFFAPIIVDAIEAIGDSLE